jgi:dTMP kinase
VEHRFGPGGLEDGVGVADVGDVELGAGRHVLAPTLREIVENVHLVATLEERPDDVRADEPRSPGYDRPHRARILGVVGALVAIEGIDGAGKGTQAARVAERAVSKGYRVASFSFPLYDGNPFSRAVADYLNGEFGGAGEVHPELAALLYAGDRFHARPQLVAALEECDLVVCDRYVASNAAHQGAKLTGEARRRLLDWLDEVEYGEFELPRPHLVVLLDSPVALARELVGRKAVRGYTTLEADIHESDAGHSGATREVYLELARRDGWQIVTAAGDEGELRDVDAIAGEVWAAVETLLR